MWWQEPWWDEAVATDDEPLPSAHLGALPIARAYPYGAYWSADRPVGVEADEPVDYSVSGSVIRLMWDYGVQIPLWDAHGLLPEEPEWLGEALGLSARLIDDLKQWGFDMNEVDAAPRRRTKEAYEALNLRGEELTNRLQQEVGSRYRVRYHPW